MKKLNQISLIAQNKEALSKLEMQYIKGGDGCNCSCTNDGDYADSGMADIDNIFQSADDSCESSNVICSCYSECDTDASNYQDQRTTARATLSGGSD